MNDVGSRRTGTIQSTWWSSGTCTGTSKLLLPADDIAARCANLQILPPASLIGGMSFGRLTPAISSSAMGHGKVKLLVNGNRISRSCTQHGIAYSVPNVKLSHSATTRKWSRTCSTRTCSTSDLASPVRDDDAASSLPLCINGVASPLSSTSWSHPSAPDTFSICWVRQPCSRSGSVSLPRGEPQRDPAC